MGTVELDESWDCTQPRWSSCALLTIDMQVDFADPDGAAYVAGTAEISPTLVTLLQSFRRHQRPVIHAVRLYDASGNDAELSRRARIRNGPPLVRPGTTGACLLPQMQCALPPGWTDAVKRRFVEISRQEWVFYKPRWSAFFKTPLADHLAAHGLDTLVVAGCNFPNCPSATIFDATERDLRVVLAIDAVSMTGPDTRAWCRGLGVLPMPATEIDSNLSSSP